MMLTFKGNHLLLEAMTGLPFQVSDEKVRALAIAKLNFNKQFPDVVMSPKWQAIFGMVAASGAAYVPAAATVVVRMKEKAAARKGRSTFNIPRENPQAARPASAPPATEHGVGGDKFVLNSGVQVADGQLRFE